MQSANRAASGQTGDDSYHRPRTSEELTALNVQTIARLEEAERDHSLSFRLVESIITFCGSIPFLFGHLVVLSAWFLWNTLAPQRVRFDPYPFGLLAMTVSVEGILLATIILIGQNRQSRMAERRNHLDLQINLLAEQETTKLLSMLSAIARQLGVDDKEDPDVAVLEEATRPDRLVEQIREVIENQEKEKKA